ncbi:MAG: hypothetical protein H6581_27800 [Bacteroidia bacterium]|nr:hypothetical protein [Bacteroidia bacterium]
MQYQIQTNLSAKGPVTRPSGPVTDRVPKPAGVPGALAAISAPPAFPPGNRMKWISSLFESADYPSETDPICGPGWELNRNEMTGADHPGVAQASGKNLS